MKRTAKGVIVSRADLKVLSAAVELAIENVRMDMTGNRRPNSAFHDPEYKAWERSIRESLRTYLRYRDKLAKVSP